MLRLGSILVACTTLAGCGFELPQTQPNMVWLRLDGQRGAENPVLTKQFETDRAICLGAQQDDNPSQPDKPAAKVCMADKGYIQVPEDQAEAKIRELEAVNTKR
jgi:hypothetical protein